MLALEGIDEVLVMLPDRLFQPVGPEFLDRVVIGKENRK